MTTKTKARKPRKARLKKLRIPEVAACKEIAKSQEFSNFPLEHYSYSSFTKFSTNPFMFKVNNINGDQLETTSKPTNVIGRACHKALEAYFGSVTDNDGEAIKKSHEAGTDFLAAFSDNFIEYSDTVPNRAKLDEKFAFSLFGYLKEINLENEIKEILMVEKMLQHQIKVDGKILPIPIKGAPDLVYRDKQGRIIIRDHKFTAKYSPTEEIDGAKLIQAAFNFFLVYAETGEPPYSMIYEEFKIVENRDKSRQTREFEIVFGDHPLIFDFFFRFYEDVTNALLGKMVFVPNLYAIFDREVAILAYIHRLDVDEERDKVFKTMKVDNITDFLKKKIQKDGAMKKYLETVSQKFISANTLNYKDMTTEEKIKMKLAEHGMAVDFHSKIDGGSLTLYRYEASIGLKMSKIESYAKDIEQVVETTGIRVLAPIPNSGLIGFEVPTKVRTFPGKAPEASGFNVPLGVNIVGEQVSIDIRTAPHILIAGTTGSGKSVCMSNLISSSSKISNVSIHLIDPKMVELSPFAGAAASYHDDIEEIKSFLAQQVNDMDERYRQLQKSGVRNVADLGSPEYRFIFIDEFADLIMQDRHKKQATGRKSTVTEKRIRGTKITTRESGQSEISVEDMIIRLAQKGRAAGFHIIMATQRPSVDIISGLIKANFPTRIAFRTSTSTDSIVILDQAGAEKLLGKGDMLVLSPERSSVDRLQGYSY